MYSVGGVNSSETKDTMTWEGGKRLCGYRFHSATSPIPANPPRYATLCPQYRSCLVINNTGIDHHSLLLAWGECFCE